MSKKNVEERRSHVNVGTIGHVNHRKTALAVAIAECFYGFKTNDQIDDVIEECERSITISTARVDCLGHADYVKNLITGAAQRAFVPTFFK